MLYACAMPTRQAACITTHSLIQLPAITLPQRAKKCFNFQEIANRLYAILFQVTNLESMLYVLSCHRCSPQDRAMPYNCARRNLGNRIVDLQCVIKITTKEDPVQKRLVQKAGSGNGSSSYPSTRWKRMLNDN